SGHASCFPRRCSKPAWAGSGCRGCSARRSITSSTRWSSTTPRSDRRHGSRRDTASSRPSAISPAKCPVAGLIAPHVAGDEKGQVVLLLVHVGEHSAVDVFANVRYRFGTDAFDQPAQTVQPELIASSVHGLDDAVGVQDQNVAVFELELVFGGGVGGQILGDTGP